MLDKIFQNLRLLIVGFGFGVILSGVIYSWNMMPTLFKAFFCVALLFVLGFAIRFTILSHKEYAHNE